MKEALKINFFSSESSNFILTINVKQKHMQYHTQQSHKLKAHFSVNPPILWAPHHALAKQ